MRYLTRARVSGEHHAVKKVMWVETGVGCIALSDRSVIICKQVTKWDTKNLFAKISLRLSEIALESLVTFFFFLHFEMS